MLQSTGNKQLDGAALEAYSQWRFQPGTGSQVRFRLSSRSGQNLRQPNKRSRRRQFSIPILILLGFGVAVLSDAWKTENLT
jgi:hypothetical protein